MDRIALIAGLLLPWLLGMAAIAAARRREPAPDAAGEIAWVAGAGYFVGALLLTLWMRALSLANVRFGVIVIALPLVIATVALAFAAWRRDRQLFAVAVPAAIRTLFASPGLGGGARLLWWLLLALLGLHFALLGLEVMWRPLYPWDAWFQWATKTRVWYELGRIVPFGRAAEWFAANGAVYFDAFPEYPPTIPLLQVWANISLGHWDDALMNGPWWQMAVALCVAVYGGLRRLGVTAIGALVGALLVGSLPLANVHVALAGYADFPLAAYFTVAVIAFLCWNATRTAQDAVLALLLFVGCTEIKYPGLYWVMTVVPGVVVALLPRKGQKLAGIAFGIAMLLVAVLAQTNVTLFQYQMHLDFDPVWRSLGETFFLLGNWNLLWYGLIGIVALLRRRLLDPPLAPFTIVIAGGLLFLLLLCLFTNAREWLAPQTTVTRDALHIAPLVAVYLVLSFHVFAARWTAAHPASTVPATADSAAEAPSAV